MLNGIFVLLVESPAVETLIEKKNFGAEMWKTTQENIFFVKFGRLVLLEA